MLFIFTLVNDWYAVKEHDECNGTLDFLVIAGQIEKTVKVVIVNKCAGPSQVYERSSLTIIVCLEIIHVFAFIEDSPEAPIEGKVEDTIHKFLIRSIIFCSCFITSNFP